MKIIIIKIDKKMKLMQAIESKFGGIIFNYAGLLGGIRANNIIYSDINIVNIGINDYLGASAIS